ncbi:MAG: TonB-dependent receptor [Melioribacteraceae bacterium]|nr:TonB-dependent receptor [Melioribacteraceae bacterium]
MWNSFPKSILIAFILVLSLNSIFAQSPGVVISGRVTVAGSNEPLPNCNIIEIITAVGCITDENGYYKLKLPVGHQKIKFSYIGYSSKIISKNIKENTYLNIQLKKELIEQGEVVVIDSREELEVSVQQLQAEDIKQMPTIYSDVLRSVKILPGVTSNNELSSSYNVRGGNYDENLIYLNGYEVYRPFLLKNGVEENQSIINGDLVKSLNFYGGGFSARFGDKMSSALEVNYNSDVTDKLTGITKVNLYNAAFSLKKKFGKLSLVGGVRYAFPNLFLDKIQTRGSYNPRFSDIQILANYKINKNSGLELFILNATNKFNVTPESWSGHYKGVAIFDVKEIRLEYDGDSKYSFNTGLIGLRYSNILSERQKIDFSIARYSNNEREKANLEGRVYYLENVYNPDDRLYLKSRFEQSDNYLDMSTYELKFDWNYNLGSHSLSSGINLKLSDLKNRSSEFLKEVGDSSVHETPIQTNYKQNESFNSYAFYIQDKISLGESVQMNLGVRALSYQYNKEFIISPRIGLFWYINKINTLKFSYGHYYQPPYFYEIKNKNLNDSEKLKAQKSIHYILGWEYKAKPDLTFQAELYHKKLSNIIPYHVDQLKLEYSDENNYEGYAYGLDLLVKGEISDGMNSWIGYSYLSSKEREAGTKDYQRRLLDQSHTLQIFIQDKMKKSKHIQAHVRFLVGSGFLYHPRSIEYNEANNRDELAIDYESSTSFSRYLRADMGLSAKYNLGNDWNIILVAEVFNIFNNYNVASYSWYQILPNDRTPVRVPHIYSKRFFNLSAEISF